MSKSTKVTKTYDNNTQTLIGTKQRMLVDVETGEEVLVDQITKRVYGSKQFWKMYLMDFLMVLGIIDSKQVDIFIYVVENTDPRTNIFLGTYKKIAGDLHVSETTIARIFKKLQANNFVKKLQNGAWLVNPNILMKGDERKRQILLSYYESDTPINRITMSRTKRSEIHEEYHQMDVSEIPGILPEEVSHE